MARESNRVEGVGSEADWAYVQRVQRGETDAFETLVLRHQKRLFNLAYRMLSDYEEATEATQEVFLLAFRAVGQFRGESSFSTWLYRIALNHVGTRRKNLAVQRSRTAELDGLERAPDRFPDPLQVAARRQDESIRPPPRFPDPAQFVASQQTRSLVQQALNNLSPEHCQIIALIDMQGVSYEDAGEMIGIKIETVKTRLHRARQALKIHLAPYFKD